LADSVGEVERKKDGERKRKKRRCTDRFIFLDLEIKKLKLK
jgi:hypothetical protein